MTDLSAIAPNARAIFVTLFSPDDYLVLSFVPSGGTKPTASEGFLDEVAFWDRHDQLVVSGHEVFVACATFAHDPRAPTGRLRADGKPEKHGRKKENVKAIRALRGDVDIDPSGMKNGRPCFKNIEEALAELARLQSIHGFRYPTLILKSGGGLHLWWRLDRDVPAVEAAPLLKAFCGAMQAVDPRVVADPLRWIDLNGLLRAPHSYNKKYDPPTGRLVEPYAFSSGDWIVEDASAWCRAQIGTSHVSQAAAKSAMAPHAGANPRVPDTINMDWVRNQFAALTSNPDFATAVQDRSAWLESIVFPLANAAATSPEHRVELLEIALRLSALGGDKFDQEAEHHIHAEFERASQRLAEEA